MSTTGLNPLGVRRRFAFRIVTTFLFTTLCATAIASPVLAQNICADPPVGPITQKTELSISTPTQSCTLSPTDGDGGYLRVNGGPYKLHVDTEVTGHCQQRDYFHLVGCVNTILHTRTIGPTQQYVAGVLVSIIGPVVTSTVQDYDTRTSTNTVSNGYSWFPPSIAKYVYTSSTGATATICGIAPTSFPQLQALTVHALSCKPQFDIGRFHPAPNSTVQIYLPPWLASRDADLQYVIDQWNPYLALYSVVLQKVTSPCGTGPSCINFEATTLPSPTLCGYARYDPGDTSTGFHTGGLKIQLQTTHASYNSQGMRRTMAHELQHLLGLFDYGDYCLAESDALMNPNFECDNSEQLPATGVTPNDHIPVLNTVYGGKSGRSCGF